MNAPARFVAIPATRQEEPLLLGIIGPPGGGKSLSSLKIAKGIQAVRGGPIRVIDTEGGRSRKYGDLIPFDIVEMQNGRSEDFLAAINAQLPDKPAAIIVDSMSDEHEQYLEWHDEEVPRSGGNDWAAWRKPSASRKKLITGILKIKTPLIFTFRAREKTKQDGKKVINIGWQPVAPLEIVHTLDLTCILPPRADGVPVWKSDKIGEDFIIKLPNYLAPFIRQGQPLSEEMGRAFAEWARGGSAPDSAAPAARPAAPAADGHGQAPAAGAEKIPSAGAYIDQWNVIIAESTDAAQLGAAWKAQADLRRKIEWPDKEDLDQLIARVRVAIENLKS
jgi:hypothetical protein